MTKPDGGFLLEVDGLDITAAGHLRIANAVSFGVAPGEVVAIVGESGSGKTMVARSILGLLPPGLAVQRGAIRFQGRNLRDLSAPDLRAVRGAKIGMVFQEPMTSLNPALAIGRQLDEGLRLHTRLSGAARRERILAMLERVGIPDAEHCLRAFPHEFSGGMRQRIMLASVMLLAPALLIADEPTTALDAVVQRDVLELMIELTRAHNTAILLISHDLAMVARYATRAVVMHRGEVVEQGPTDQILLAPRHAYTRHLLEALPRRKPARPLAGSDPVIEAEGLVVDYPGRRRLFGRAPGKRAVDGVSLSVARGETVAVVGGSGSGKTTLGKALIGLLPTSAGSIRFKGRDLATASRTERWDFRMGAQIVFQDPYSSLDPRMRVEDIVGEPLRLLPGAPRSERQARIRRTLLDVGLGDEHLRRYPHQLSGGQRQRVAIARAIIRNPSFVIADEPVSALDMTVQKQILDLFAALQARYGFACLFISHDLGAVEQVADRVIVMKEGRIVEQGPRDRIFDHPTHPYTRRLLSAIPALEPAGGGFRLRSRFSVVDGEGRQASSGSILAG